MPGPPPSRADDESAADGGSRADGEPSSGHEPSSGREFSKWRSVLASAKRTAGDRAEVAVFVSGVASMGLEILAGRLIAPEFGSSIYTWGSIIGVFLAALSAGYYLGGRRAARRATYGNLAVLQLNAALYVALLIFAAEAVLASADALPVGARFVSIVPVTLLFGPPTFLLGFISPYAAELSGGGTGEASGRVYAVGTIGSIAGTFFTTFVLIPALDVTLVELGFGTLLIAGAVWTLGPQTLLRRRPTGSSSAASPSGSSASDHAVRAALIAFVLLTAFVASSAGFTLSTAVQGDTIYETQTPYQDLRVADSNGVRTLYLDGQPHSATYLDGSNEHVFEYTQYFHLPFLMAEDPDEIDKVLFVGGGGFTGPKRFVADYNVSVDVVEIDPEVIGTSKEYFSVEESPRLDIHNMDARQYLQETNETYDLIVLDAYKKDQVPFHLTTLEFMRLVSSRLDGDGMVLSNIISAPRGSASQFYRAERKTMNRVFAESYAFTTSDAGVVQNIEIVATKRETNFSERELRRLNDRRQVGIDLGEAVSGYQGSVPTGDVPVLRDDRAPVDRLLDPMLGSRYVIESAGNETANANGANASARTSEATIQW